MYKNNKNPHSIHKCTKSVGESETFDREGTFKFA